MPSLMHCTSLDVQDRLDLPDAEGHHGGVRWPADHIAAEAAAAPASLDGDHPDRGRSCHCGGIQVLVLATPVIAVIACDD